MGNFIKTIIARGRAFGIQNSEQFAIMSIPVFHRPLKGVNGKYFGGNNCFKGRRRKRNG